MRLNFNLFPDVSKDEWSLIVVKRLQLDVIKLAMN